MAEREQLEQTIREILAVEDRAVRLADKLFRPDGLFAQLAPSQQERRALIRSPLFVEAQRRLSELQQREGADFARRVEQSQLSRPEGTLVMQLQSIGGSE